MKIHLNIPIIIPFKETSIRCPGKNFLLYPKVLDWLLDEGVDTRIAYVVTKSDNVKKYVQAINKARGLSVHVLSEPEWTHDNLDASYSVAKRLKAEYYIELPLTQPLRMHGLIKKIINKKNEKYDFITSYENITDHRIFLLSQYENKFVEPSEERKGCLCKSFRMIDGSIYLIKTEFIAQYFKKKIKTSLNSYFWAGKFKAILNKVLFFIDVDSVEDLTRLNSLRL